MQCLIQFINFLDKHSGSLTFLITVVYVIATILICYANIKAANATREQVKGSKRQFDEDNRAYITYSFIYEKRAFYGVRFTNHGKRVAEDVQILLKQEFINSLNEDDFASSLNSINAKRSILGVGQSFDIYVGSSQFRENQCKLPIEGEVIYSDDRGEYREPFCIDFNNYPPIFSVQGIDEDIREEIKQQTQELAKIQEAIQNLSKSLQKEAKDV